MSGFKQGGCLHSAFLIILEAFLKQRQKVHSSAKILCPVRVEPMDQRAGTLGRHIEVANRTVVTAILAMHVRFIYPIKIKHKCSKI